MFISANSVGRKPLIRPTAVETASDKPSSFKHLQPSAEMGQSKSKPLQTAIFCSVTAATAVSACAYGLARAFEDGVATPGELFLALTPVAVASACFALGSVQGRRLALARHDLENELAHEREVSGLRLKAVESLAI